MTCLLLPPYTEMWFPDSNWKKKTKQNKKISACKEVYDLQWLVLILEPLSCFLWKEEQEYYPIVTSWTIANSEVWGLILEIVIGR